MAAEYPICLPRLGETIHFVESFDIFFRSYSGLVVGIIDSLPNSDISPAVSLLCSDGSTTDWLHLDDCVFLDIKHS